MKLADFMRLNRLSDQQMADAIGQCSEFAVRKWRYGERVPRGAVMVRIHEATSGAVTANDFLPAKQSGAAA